MSLTPSEPFKRYTCTADAPWSSDKGRYAEHPDAVHVRDEEHDGGDCEIFHCPHCDKTFHVEMPD